MTYDDRVSMAVHLGALMLDAARDLHALGQSSDVLDLHRRFLGWVRPAGSSG